MVAVVGIRQNSHAKNEIKTRKSDAVLEGIYFFGGKDSKGKLDNKIRYFRPVTVDRKVVQGEFMAIKA